MRLHQETAQRHEAAAALWDTRREADRAEFERRCARIEGEAAQLDADRAELERLRTTGLARPDAAVHAEINRVTGEINRRSARLRADDSALEQECDCGRGMISGSTGGVLTQRRHRAGVTLSRARKRGPWRVGGRMPER